MAICGRSADRLAAARDADGRLETFPCDVADEADLRTLIPAVRERVGGLSILINNAGIQFNDVYPESALETVSRNLDQEIAVNLTGLIKLSILALPDLAASGRGAIVNVSSVLAIVPKKTAPVYCATKAAVRSFSKALRYQIEDARMPVRVVDLQPPLVATGMTAHRTGPKIAPERVARALLRGLRRDHREIRVADTKVMWALYRLSPRLAEHMLRNG